MWKYTPLCHTNQRVEIIQFWFVKRIEKRQKFVSDRQIKPKASGNDERSGCPALDQMIDNKANRTWLK